MPADALKAWNLGQTFSPAQTVGYGISQVTVPLVLVMLPRVARANAMGVGSSLLRVTLTCTGTIAGVAALASTVMPRLPLQVMFFNNPGNWVAAPLVPWFAWAMVPLMVSNVLLNDMVGRGVSRVAWIVAGCAVGYVATLHVLRPSLVAMPPMEAYRTGVTVLLAATSIMLAACLIARWRWFPSPAGPIAR
jgi:O-antigen/teichoic acid export membrane protein